MNEGFRIFEKKYSYKLVELVVLANGVWTIALRLGLGFGLGLGLVLELGGNFFRGKLSYNPKLGFTCYIHICIIFYA